MRTAIPRQQQRREADRLRWDARCAFTERVAAATALFPRAHDAMRNWGRWSRDDHGPKEYDAMPWAKLYDVKDYDDQDVMGEGEAAALAIMQDNEQAPMPIRVLEAQQVDVFLHQPDCPVLWRDVARAYYYMRLPEDRLPHVTGLQHTMFVSTLTFLLEHITTKLGPCA